MKRATLALALVMALLFSAVAGVMSGDLAQADPYVLEYLPYITINSDGTITPETEFINRTGRVYTLTANISQKYTIVIECSNIMFDGAGHSINCSKSGYSNSGLRLTEVTNVTVQNLEVYCDNYKAIWLYNCSNCKILRVNTAGKDVFLVSGNFNTIAESNISIGLDGSNNNIIIRNKITEMHIAGYDYEGHGCTSNAFYENNLFCNISLIVEEGVSSYLVNSANFWDNDSVGNYWSNYKGTDADSNGIGDTPYIIDAKNIDNYPLMYPWGAPDVTVFRLENATCSGSILLSFTLSKSAKWIGYSLDGKENITISGNTTLTGLANGEHDLTIYAMDEAGNVGASETVYFSIDVPFPTIIVVASVASVAVAVVGLLVYFKKRKS